MLDKSTEALLRMLNADQPQEQIIDHLVAQARRSFGATAVAYFRVEPEQESIFLDASVGFSPDLSGAGGEWELGSFLEVFGLRSSQEATARRLNLTDAIWWQGRSDRPGSSRLRSWLAPLRETLPGLVVVTMRIRSGLAGIFLLFYASVPEAEQVQLDKAMRFAIQAALIVENAQLRRQAEQAAVLQERSRLARDLHDSVTQSLYSLTLLAEATRRLAKSGDPTQAVTVANRLGEIGQQALKEMRLLVYQLRPLMLRRVGLVRALSQRLETVERRAGVEASLAVDGEISISPALEEQLYYLVQEALNNALKHASATAVQVRIEHGPGRLYLEVKDDGRGFTVEEAGAQAGFGLASMRERVEKLGGDFAITSVPGEGTAVSVTLTGTGEEERNGDG